MLWKSLDWFRFNNIYELLEHHPTIHIPPTGIVMSILCLVVFIPKLTGTSITKTTGSSKGKLLETQFPTTADAVERFGKAITSEIYIDIRWVFFVMTTTGWTI